MTVEVQVVDTIAELDREEWQRLAGANPTLGYDFLHALHASGCASPASGWTPCYIVMRRDGVLVGAMPLYAKTHSRGEYVFDHAWAEAFHRHGLRYYPKLLSAVPFTPVTGARLLAQSEEDKRMLAQAAIQVAQSLEVSSLHVLFPQEEDRKIFAETGYLLREGVQFHWENPGYGDFDAFLATLKPDKRKKLRQDKRRVADAGVTFRHLAGSAITDSVIQLFYSCYLETYAAHYSSPYLTLEFFRSLRASAPETLMIVLAERAGHPIAAALNLVGGNVMYGRYWGTTEFVSGLHFETCYVQAIEYCIRHGIAKFEGGAQGEHKMARGLVPIPTWSAHWIADPKFSGAIAAFLERETTAIEQYIDELEEHAPFKP